MHLTSIQVENVRALRGLEWNISASQGAGWHVLVGDNGAGKSTLLAAIAVALLGPKAAMQLRKTWSGWVSWGAETGSVRLEFVFDEQDDALDPNEDQRIAVSFEKGPDSAGEVRELEGGGVHSVWNSEHGCFSASYGPFRRLAGGDPSNRRFAESFPKVGRHISLFEEGVALTEVVDWLQRLHYESLEESKGGALLGPLIDFINHDDFLPFGMKLHSVSSSDVRFSDGSGAEIRLGDLSDGFRSILSMTLELIRQLSIAYGPQEIFDPEDRSKIRCSGVVLIDEIDVHLHPTWQQQVGLWFRDHFPNMQFLVTTHSPLVCQASGIGTVYRLPHLEGGTVGGMVSPSELERLVYGNVLDAFGTGVFGADVVRSKQSSEALERLAQLNVEEMDRELSRQERSEQADLRMKLPSEGHALSPSVTSRGRTTKRIVICADGTWNVRDQIDDDSGQRRPTNVTKTARAILSRANNGVDQVVIYHDGLGTRGPLDKVTGGAFGKGIEDNIRNLYRSIVYNYEVGDELFFFGFSRGAFTVRSLVGFMNLVGLVEKDDDYYVPEIYRCYERNKRPGSKEWQKAFHNVDATRPCPRIKYIGVWDTVGSLGAPGVIGKMASVFNGNKYAYHDVGLNQHIENAYHALAIDERRKPFLPTLWTRPEGWSGQLEQAWFSGVHSNVGGGYKPDGLANEALHWMLRKAESVGLETDWDYLKFFEPHFDSKLHDSMSMKYRLFGPVRRTIGAFAEHGECIHDSAIRRTKHPEFAYVPENLLDADVSLPVVNTKH